MPFYNRIKESGRIINSGSIQLLGPYPGFITFLSGFPDRSLCYYTFESGGTNWEVGYGAVSGSVFSGPSITRHIVYSSSQNNNKINATSGIYTVFSTPPAKHFDDLDMMTYMGMI